MSALMTPAAAARLLCISEKHLRALTVAGEIRYINVGLGTKRETRRYDPQDLAAFQEARTTTSAKSPAIRPPRSYIDVSDFQARLDARKNAKLKRTPP